MREKTTDDISHVERLLARRCLADFATYTDPRYQVNWHHAILCNYLDRFVTKEIRRLMVFMPPRHGKALAVDTPIPTPEGWVAIGEIKPGDFVFDENGQSVRVVAVSPVWRNRPVYHVHTDCGDTITADAAHEWLVRLDRKHGAIRKYETQFLAKRTCKRAPMVSKAKALETTDVDLPIDPYVLGVWLGDGRTASAAICSPDQEIIDEVMRIEGGGNYYASKGDTKHFRLEPHYRNPGVMVQETLQYRLRSLGLIRNKHIPAAYLRASIKQRLSLLQGLIDTDGYVAADGQIEFCSISKALADNVHELVRTLGHKASIVTGRAKCGTKDCGEKYRVMFYMEGAALLKRKAERTRHGARAFRTYLTFEPAGCADTVCIEVDSPTHMFLCGRSMTPTCNSELVSRKLPAFIFGKNPDAEIIAASYGADLAQRMNRDTQRIIDSQQYYELFPETTLSSKANRSITLRGNYLRNSDIFEIRGHRGSYRCAGVGGAIMGMGATCIIVDDPIKNREEANSLAYRDKIWDWYTSTLYTRLEKDAAILITLTRWHEDDLAGRLLELAEKEPGSDQWEVLSIPAICELDNKHPDDPRDENMALWPDKYTYADLMRIKATIGIYEWSALYQQRPQPAGGTIFKREWMNKTYRELPAGATIIQSWDLPFKASEASAKCAGIVMARKGAEIYFVHVVNDKMSFTDSITAIKDMTAKYPKARAKVVEDKANGPAIISYLQKDIPGMIPFNPRGSKEDRALSVAPYFEAGNVYFPEYASWKGDLIDDFLRFPTGVYKDTVDAGVQGILYLMDKPHIKLGESSDALSKDSYWRKER